MLELIGERPRYVQELADMLDVRHPTVVHHLALLRHAGLIESYTDEGTTYYTLQPTILEDVVAHPPAAAGSGELSAPGQQLGGSEMTGQENTAGEAANAFRGLPLLS